MRADALRNRALLVDAAKEVFAERGPEASLDEIARRAGVGPGTLYRHFPTRQDLQETVLRDKTEAVIAQGYAMLDDPDPFRALGSWMHAVAVHSTAYRGLARSLMVCMLSDDAPSPRMTWKDEGHAAMYAVGTALVERGQHAGVVRADLEVAEVLRLANAVALATEQGAGGGPQVDRLLALVMDGLRVRDASHLETESRFDIIEVEGE